MAPKCSLVRRTVVRHVVHFLRAALIILWGPIRAVLRPPNHCRGHTAGGRFSAAKASMRDCVRRMAYPGFLKQKIGFLVFSFFKGFYKF